MKRLCLPGSARRASERGNTLVVTLVVIVVLTLVATSAITRAGVEVDAAGMHRRYSAEVSCAQAAREFVMSALALSGTVFTGVSMERKIMQPNSNIPYLTLRTGHYDRSGAGMVTVDTTGGNCGAAAGAGSTASLRVVGDLVNVSRAAGSSGSGGGGGAGTCGVRIPVTCTDAAGRIQELEFQVRIGL